MKYINVAEVLPNNLLNEIQKYITGEILYIPQPKGLINSWESKTGIKQEISNRNKEIRAQKECGKTIDELMLKYNLSYDTIRLNITNFNSHIQHPNEEIMRELINDQWTKDSIFAAVIDNEGNIVSKGKTTVCDEHDPTAHAEINAIRAACKMLGTDVLPKGYWLYSTFEPCPLCAAAVIWAGFEGVVYANNPDFRGKEINWSFIKCKDILKSGKYINEVALFENFLLDEIKDYFK